MALSTEINLNYTAGQLVDRALQKLGVLGQGFTASSDEYANAQAVLNEQLAHWQTSGANLWTVATQSVSLATGTQDYTLSPRPRLVMNARRVDNGSESVPLTEWARQDWDKFIYKTSTGLPIKYVVDKQRTATVLSFWPLPTFTSGTYSVNVGYERAYAKVTASANDVDIPEEFMETAILCLAARLAEDYRLSAQPEVVRIMARAESAFAQVMNYDRAGDVRFVLRR